MKMVALFLALILERLGTHLFHWRELRWLDPLFDFGIGLGHRWRDRTGYGAVVFVILLALFPVLLVRFVFDETLLGLPYLALSVVVLFLCLGPQDIGEEVDRWRRAIDEGDREAERINARALLERGFNDTTAVRTDIPGAIFVQANNRMFAVIFWFVLLGPVGAWLYRVTDLLRRRIQFQSQRAGAERQNYECVDGVHDVQAILAFLPAQLSTLGFILGGHYDAGSAAWRWRPPSQNEALLASVGVAALQATRTEDETDTAYVTRHARAAKNLVLRTLGLWLVGIAVLTLVGVAI